MLEELSFIRENRWSDNDRYALPFGLELCREDIDKIWDKSSFVTADLIAFGTITPSNAHMFAETQLDNLKMLYKKLVSRVPGLQIEMAKRELDFDLRRDRYKMAYLQIIAISDSSTQDHHMIAQEYEKIEYFMNRYLEKHSNDDVPQRRGRKPAYPWDDCKTHMQKLFEHHGWLSLDDPVWCCQADVERAIIEFMEEKVGKAPATSLVREHAKQYIKSFNNS